jgi:hypothetical protein
MCGVGVRWGLCAAQRRQFSLHRTLWLEHLESRMLLAADLMLRADTQANTRQLLDLENGAHVIQEGDLGSSEPFAIEETSAADRLKIDFSTPFTHHGGLPTIDNLTDLGSYFVSAIDPHRLRLAQSQEVADNWHESTFTGDLDVREYYDDSFSVRLSGEVPRPPVCITSPSSTRSVLLSLRTAGRGRSRVTELPNDRATSKNHM